MGFHIWIRHSIFGYGISYPDMGFHIRICVSISRGPLFVETISKSISDRISVLHLFANPCFGCNSRYGYDRIYKAYRKQIGALNPSAFAFLRCKSGYGYDCISKRIWKDLRPNYVCVFGSGCLDFLDMDSRSSPPSIDGSCQNTKET